jgi:hypothetical protein
MLVDYHHPFRYRATVPWPGKQEDPQLDWVYAIEQIEGWLRERIGPRYQQWAYDDCPITYNIGVAFRWDKDKTMFILTWGI